MSHAAPFSPYGEAGQMNVMPPHIAQALQQLHAELEVLKAKNIRTFADMQREGTPMFEPVSMLFGRVESLIDTITEVLPPAEGPLFAVMARLRWEQKVEAEQAAVRTTGKLNTIAEGGSFSPEMIRALASATGTFGGGVKKS
jgi:hypothetical protein